MRAFLTKVIQKEARVFLVFLGFVMLLSFSALKLTDTLHQNLAQTLSNEVVKERILNEQIRILAERRVLIRDVVLAEDPFDRDEKIQQHAEQARAFLMARNQLLEMDLSPVEKAIFEQQLEINRKSYQSQYDFIEALIEDDIEDPSLEIYREVLPLMVETNDRLMTQRAELVVASDKTRLKAREQYEKGWEWVLVLYVLSLLFSGVLALWMYYRQKAHQFDLEYQATHDALTGLSNRVEFERELIRAIDDTHVNHTQHVVLYLDLDQFKIVNDTCGHIAGDELLINISEEMRRCVRGSDLLSRLGGDEFGVLLWDCNEDKGKEIAENIRRAVDDFHFTWSGREFSVGVSIGLVSLDGEFQDATQVMSAVDVACYIAKDHGRNQVHSYSMSDSDSVARHGEIHSASQIQQAIATNQFHLYYQEICPIGKHKSKKKIELLLRMQKGDALISPEQFIPAAERFNLMPQIDRWVVQQVIHLLAKGKGSCLTDVDTLCINLSGASMADPAFLDFVVNAVDQDNLSGKHICFEITESAAITRLSVAVDFISHLRERGYTFALDDFGKGLSSYNYLKQLPVDFLKIDGSFVRDMRPDSPDYVFVQSINTVGKALGLQTIAEWVETKEVLSQLETLGVDFAQGHFLSDVKACNGSDGLFLPEGRNQSCNTQ